MAQANLYEEEYEVMTRHTKQAVQLNLTIEEAQMLKALTGCIKFPKKRDGVGQSVYYALSAIPKLDNRRMSYYFTQDQLTEKED